MYFAVQWKGFGTYRNVSRAIARKAGVAYLDFFPLSALRPDAAVAKHAPFPKLPNSSKVLFGIMDCLHMCLPGPPDDWSHLLFGIILERIELPWPARTNKDTIRVSAPTPREFFPKKTWFSRAPSVRLTWPWSNAAHDPTAVSEVEPPLVCRPWWPYRPRARNESSRQKLCANANARAALSTMR